MILGYDPEADPIPLFREESRYCWVGPSGMVCDSEGKWEGSWDGHPITVRCATVYNKKHYCNADAYNDEPAQNLFRTEQVTLWEDVV